MSKADARSLKDYEKRANDLGFYSQAQIEKIFVRGFGLIVDNLEKRKNGHRGKESTKANGSEEEKEIIYQDDLAKFGKQCVNEINGNSITDIEIEGSRDKAKNYGQTFYHWYKMHEGVLHPTEGANVTFGHYEPVPFGNFYDCNRLTDEWFKWFLTTPRPRNPYSNPGQRNDGETQHYGLDNAFLMQKRNTSVYFTTGAPFQQPDLKTLTLTVEAPLLVPVYNTCESRLQFPTLDDDPKGSHPLLGHAVGDLLGIQPVNVKAKLDGQNIEPCCVIRKEPLRIEGIPVDNVFGIPEDRLIQSASSIDIIHGGFWMLIRPERLGSGDHLLEWKIESIDYKMDVQMQIHSLV